MYVERLPEGKKTACKTALGPASRERAEESRQVEGQKERQGKATRGR